MQRALFALSIGTVLAIMLRPSLAESAREDIAKLRWLEHADPAADFGRQVVQQHDTRFMSVYGLSFSNGVSRTARYTSGTPPCRKAGSTTSRAPQTLSAVLSTI